MKADDSYTTLMSVPSPAKPIVVAGPRLYWRAVVRVSDHRVEWHSARCAAPANDCHGCEPHA